MGVATAAESIGTDWSLLSLLLSHDRSAPIVALGHDLESLSLVLAKTCVAVITLDHGGEMLKHLELQRLQNAVANVFPVFGCKTGYFPFRDCSVGLTIVNQVGDGVGCQHDAGLMEVGTSLLLEARRVLKAGGVLCLVVSRRHSRMGPSAMKVLLDRYGFSGSEFYIIYPQWHRFTALVPIASGRRMHACIDLLVEGNAFRERRRRVWLKTLATLGLLQSSAPEYIAIGRKER
jgi:SAM-dependent methyltransferase